MAPKFAAKEADAAAAKAAAPVLRKVKRGKRKAKVVVVVENNTIAKKPKQDLAAAAAALQKEIEEMEAELERLLEHEKSVSGCSDELEADVKPNEPVAAPAKEVHVSADNNGSVPVIETNDDSNDDSKSTEEEKPIATNGSTPAADTMVVAEGSDSEDDSDVASTEYESDENKPASTLEKAAAASVLRKGKRGKRKAKVVVVVENNTIAKKPKQDLAAAAAALQKEIEEMEAELERLLEQAKSVSGRSDELEADVKPNEPVAAPAKEVPVSADNNGSVPVIETNNDSNSDSKSTEEEVAAPVLRKVKRGKRKAKVVVVVENNTIAKKPKQDLAAAAAALQKEIEEMEAELERLLEQAKSVSGRSDQLEADVKPNEPVAAPAKEVHVSADNNGSVPVIETNNDSNADSKYTEEEKPIATNSSTAAADTMVVAEGSDSEDDSDVASTEYDSDENKPASTLEKAAAASVLRKGKRGKRKAKVVVVVENNTIAKKPKQDLAAAAAALQKEIEEMEAELERLLEQAKSVSGRSDELEADVKPNEPVAAPAKELPVSADNNGSVPVIETNNDSNADSKSTEEEAAAPVLRKVKRGKRKAKVVVVVENNTIAKKPKQDLAATAAALQKEIEEMEAELERLLEQAKSVSGRSDELEADVKPNEPVAAPAKEVPVSADNNGSVPVIETNNDSNADSKSTEEEAAAPVLRKVKRGKRKAKVVVVVENNTIAKKPKQDLAAAAAALQKEIEEMEAELERLLEQAKSVSGRSDELEADVRPNEPVAAPAKEVPVSADNNGSVPVIETNNDSNADSKSTEEEAAAPVLRKVKRGKRKAKVVVVVENNRIAKKPKQDLAAAAAALQKEIEEMEAELERLLVQAKSVSGGSDELEADVEPNEPVAAPAKEVPVSADNNGSVPVIETNDDSNDDSKSTEEEKPIATNGSTPAADTNVVDEGSDSEDDSDVGSTEYESDENKPASTLEKAGTYVKMSDVDKDAPETPTSRKAAGSKTLFAGNLSFKADEVDVRDFFGNVCEIVDVRLGTDRDGIFKGYCHVEFASEAEALRALEFNGKELRGRPIRLDIATDRGESTPNVRSSQGAQSVFVKGFDTSLGEDELRDTLKEHFGKCGEIQRISIPMKTDVPKWIAFIDFNDTEMTQKALALDNSKVGGFQLAVNAARPKAEGGGRGRSGGRFGSGGRNSSGKGCGRRGGGRGRDH